MDVCSTDEATRYFKEGCYEVVLNIIMKRQDTYVNVLIVKEAFAVSQ